MVNVKIYSTETCIWCAKAREFLTFHKVKFTELDVGSDRKAAMEMIHKSGQMGVPVIDINGKIIVGYNEGALKKALKIR